MSVEAMYLRYAVQLALREAEMDARPKPIIIPEPPPQPEPPEYDYGRTLH